MKVARWVWRRGKAGENRNTQRITLQMLTYCDLRNYKELSKIEDSFKVTKTDFDTRPVYVYKEQHIQAHFLSCFLALVLMRILQHKINYKMSPQQIINALQSARANLLTNGFYRVQANTDMRELNERIGINWESSIVTYEQLNAYSLGWFTTLKNIDKSS